MASLMTSTDSFEELAVPVQYGEASWYAAYTSANHEKRVAEQLGIRSLEHFLPLYEAVHRWRDRRVKLSLPLFPGYVFVRLALRDRLQVLRVPGVARLVGFNGAAIALPNEEIEALKASLGNGLRAEPHPFLTVGRRVRIKVGPLEGLEGIVIRRRNRLRFVISLDLIHRAAAVEIETACLEWVSGPKE